VLRRKLKLEKCFDKTIATYKGTIKDGKNFADEGRRNQSEEGRKMETINIKIK
jgi:hypothetical protein